MSDIFIREPRLEDEVAFLAAMQRSQSLHNPWVRSPQTSQDYAEYFQRYQQSDQKSFLVCLKPDNIVGVFNVSEIVRGFFQSAYLGFYAVSNYAGRGYMKAGLKLVLQNVFDEMQLHRLEVNIQPENIRSISLVKSSGFKKEGYSPRYLNINGVWCDHERWAITKEDYLADEKVNDVDKLEIVPLSETDIEEIVLAFKNIGWNKPRSIYEAYLEEQNQGLRSILVVKKAGKFCGYVTIRWQSEYGPFLAKNTPEISDLNVLPNFRKKGIATLLIRSCEQKVKERGYGEIGIGVGMTEDYGDAQRLYVRLGYLPDGRGVHYKYHKMSYNSTAIVDDDLVLFFTKQI